MHLEELLRANKHEQEGSKVRKGQSRRAHRARAYSDEDDYCNEDGTDGDDARPRQHRGKAADREPKSTLKNTRRSKGDVKAGTDLQADGGRACRGAGEQCVQHVQQAPVDEGKVLDSEDDCPELDCHGKAY
jgi:hypothetical protein